PGRVRAVHLPSNSGGCGRPRNAGVEASAGRYVMFLDSDDLLDRHACLNLVGAAEDTGADIVSGRCDRIFVDLPAGSRERVRPWYPWLYRSSAVHGSLHENPRLLYDTLSTTKAYRRAFLEEHDLRFVEDLHYEDLLFTAEAYLEGRTALIPHRVYNWLVKERTAAPSISNRRAELANFADRLEIHRRTDRLFELRGAHALGRAQDGQLVNHDLVPYLRRVGLRLPRLPLRCLGSAAAIPASGSGSSTSPPPTWRSWTPGRSRRPPRCPRSPRTWCARGTTPGRSPRPSTSPGGGPNCARRSWSGTGASTGAPAAPAASSAAASWT